MFTNKLLTLAFVIQNNRILLGLKKRGFGAGKWNGFGGKIQEDESIIEAANRELQEECGLSSNSLCNVGLLKFEFVNDPVILEVHVFITNAFIGEIKESEEMLPKWFDLSEIPYSKMWADDKFWFPLLLSGKYFSGYFKFQGQETILEYTLTEEDGLSG